MKKAYTSPLLDQHKYVQELDITPDIGSDADNTVSLPWD